MGSNFVAGRTLHSKINITEFFKQGMAVFKGNDLTFRRQLQLKKDVEMVSVKTLCQCVLENVSLL